VAVEEPLHSTLDRALDTGEGLDALGAADPVDRRDEALTLLALADLHLAPLDAVRDRARWQHHPEVARLKGRLEARFLGRLPQVGEVGDAVAAMRAIAARDLVPDIYTWVAERATREELLAYLAVEGGPDGGFDDLVALCQVGIDGGPKVELARNYWDEMGRGTLAEVHTELHRRLGRATGLRAPARVDSPVAALERSLLGSVVATNRALQPEMVGALGLLELQAGPRCRKVVQGLRRVGAGPDALAFYVEHAEADPRHGRAWLLEVVAPLARDPWWAEGIVRGATWRSALNRAFFDAMADVFVPAASATSRDRPAARAA
jgi:hypothetical protein